jgi:hypothetical protein
VLILRRPIDAVDDDHLNGSPGGDQSGRVALLQGGENVRRIVSRLPAIGCGRAYRIWVCGEVGSRARLRVGANG